LFALPAYRLYRLDGAGKITSGDWVEAEADDEALRHAQALLGGTGRFELWEKDRLIARADRPSG